MERPEYKSMYELEDVHWWFMGRRLLALSLIDKWITFQPNAHILDVGCGTGGNLQAMAGYGKTVGLDLSPIAVDFARRRPLPNLVQASGLSIPYADNTFDMVTIFDVLYHSWITDDEQAIDELYRVIRPGGWLLLTDSALPMLWSSHDRLYYARQRYTLNDISSKLSQTGFEQHVSSYANMLLLPVFLFVRLAMNWLPISSGIDQQGKFPGWLNRLLTFVRGLEAIWLSKGHSLPIGSSLVCLSQKPDKDYII